MTGCGGFRFNEVRRVETEQLALESTVVVGNKVLVFSGEKRKRRRRRKKEKKKGANWCNLNCHVRSERMWLPAEGASSEIGRKRKGPRPI